MTINPEDNDLVRTRAYLLWVEEGRPEGRDVEHWHRAAELVANEAADPKPTAAKTVPGRKRVPAEGQPRSKAAKKTPSIN